MYVTERDIRTANAEGLKLRAAGYDYPGDRHTAILSIALYLGFEGVSLADAPVVSGYRYGNVPYSGISYNFRDGLSERGLSMAQLDGAKECASCIFIGDRPEVRVSGVLLPYTGSDGEALVLPIDCIDNLDA